MKIQLLLISFCLLLASCGQKQWPVQPKENPRARRAPVEKKAEKKPVAQTQKLTATQRYKEQRKQIKARSHLLSRTPSNLKTLTYAELAHARDMVLAEGEKEAALVYTERMLALGNDMKELKVLRLEVADLLFDTGKLEKAEAAYQDYLQLYPGSDMTEYAEYKAILSSFYQTLDPGLDQSKTKNTASLAQKFLANTTRATYLADVQTIKKHCIGTLFENELDIARFYIAHNKFHAAEQRISSLRDEFSSSSPEIKIALLELEIELATKQKQGAPKSILQQKSDGEIRLASAGPEAIKVIHMTPEHQLIGTLSPLQAKQAELVALKEKIALAQSSELPQKSYTAVF